MSHSTTSASGRSRGRRSRSGMIAVPERSAARNAIADGKPRLLSYGVTNERAWEVGLTCGGKIEVFVERVE